MAVRSDLAARAVALLVCPNASPLMPDRLTERLPWITWQILTPRFERTAQSRVGSSFQVTYSVHHSGRDAAYDLAASLVEAIEGSDGMSVPGGVIANGEAFGDPTEVRSADQSLTYFQFIVTCSFYVTSV